MTLRTPQEYNWDKMEFNERLLTKHFTPRQSRDIRFFVVHHMIILNRDDDTDDALEACYNVWQTRQASAHYGVDGDFVNQYVWDKDYAWSQGNDWGNEHGISVEHANKTLDEPGTENDYVVDDKTFFTGAKLIAYGHVKYNLVPQKDATIKQHRNFSATSCPGPYMGRRFNDYCDLVHDIYNDIKTGRIDQAPPANPVRSVPQPAHRDPFQIASEVIQGIWGNGQARLEKLRTQGYNPAEIQKIVDDMLRGHIDERMLKVADEVIKGLHGVGAERAFNLRNLGFNPELVQTIVNDKLGSS